MSFSDNLKYALDLRDVQVKELSAKTGISKNTIDNYLSGQKSIPNAENAVKIAQVLNVTTEFLVTGSEKKAQNKTLYSDKAIKLIGDISLLDEIDFNSVSTLVSAMKKRYQK